MQEQLRDEIHHILEQVDEQHAGEPPSKAQQHQHTEHEAPHHASPGEGPSQAQQFQVPPRVVNVYLIDDLLSPATEAAVPQEEPMWTIESILGPQREEEETPPLPTEEGEAGPTPPLEPAPPPSSSIRGLSVRLWIALGLCLFALLLGAIAYTTLFLLATADVTIIPVAQAISITSPITVVTTGAPNPAHQQVAGRLLSVLSMSQARAISTTGKGHQEAQAAHGAVTFYNASLATQTVSAGTLLTGADGSEIVTEQDAVIPAGSLSVNGEVTVPAHAVQVGPAGNIRAGDIYGPCCRLNVFAANGPFSGGQDARDYPMVTQQDLDGLVTALKADLSQSVQAAFQAQVHAGDETLITPVPCTPTMTADHQVGDEAAHLSVTVSQTCTGATYNTQGLQTLMTQGGDQQAAKQLGEGYSLVDEMQVKVMSVGAMTKAPQKPGTLTVQVKATGTWAYQFSEAQLHHLSSMIAGKTTAQATTLLLREAGVSQVMLHLSRDQATLPTDAGNIHILVMYTTIQP